MPAFRGHLAFSGYSSWSEWTACEQVGTGHPQVRQGKQGVQLLGVLAQAFVSNFDVTELLLDHSKWVFDLGPNTGFNLFESLLQSRDRVCTIFCVNGSDFSERRCALQTEW